MKYSKLLNQRDILTMLKCKVYTVDLETAEVKNSRGNVIKPVPDDKGRLFVRLYWSKGRKTIFLNRLVWMAATLRTIPAGFEIHHRDENHNNDAWTNLYCLFEMDHQKLHGGDLLNSKKEEVPF